MNTDSCPVCPLPPEAFSRRALLKTLSCGFGYLAFAGLATRAAAAENPLAPRAPHFPARAKRVIFLTMRGGYEAVENKVQIHDLHATMLALLGLDHEKLTYRYAGRDFRLTDVKGSVVKEIIA